MKIIFNRLLLVLITITAWQCSNTPVNKEQIAEHNPVPPNKKREKKAVVKVLREYKINPSDTIGFLIRETFYNEKGLQVKIQSYDFYGTGKKDGLSTWEYNEKGLPVKDVSIFGDEVTTTLYKYDEAGNRIADGWSRPNGQHERKEYTYKDGRVMEEKSFDQKDKYIASYLYEYELDNKGRIKSEKRWSKYFDGSPQSLSYWFDYTYGSNDSLAIKKNIEADNSEFSREERKYDDAGNLIDERHYLHDSLDNVTQIWYNEYGDYILDSLWNGNKEYYQFRNIYRYDNFGNQVYHMYTHLDGEAWGSRFEIEYY